MSKEEFVELLDEVCEKWRQEVMAGFWRDGDGYIAPTDPVDEFMDEVRSMLCNG